MFIPLFLISNATIILIWVIKLVTVWVSAHNFVIVIGVVVSFVVIIVRMVINIDIGVVLVIIIAFKLALQLIIYYYSISSPSD